MKDLEQGGHPATRTVVLMADLDGVIVDASGGAAEMIGLESLIGRSLLDLCDDLGAGAVADIITGRTGAIQTELRTWAPGGAEAPIIVDVDRMSDGRHLVATFTIGASVLSPVGDALHLVRAASSEGIFDWDLHSGQVWWSPELRAMLGRPSDPAVGTLEERFEGIVHPDDFEAAQAAVGKVARGEARFYNVEMRMRTPAGVDRWYLVRGASERSPSGEVVRVAGSVLDVHERRQAEEEIQKRERRYRELANSLPQFVWSARPDGTVDEFNDRFHELTDLPRESEVEDAWLTLVHRDDRASLLERWSDSLATGEPYECRFRLRISGEYRWYLGQARAELDGDGSIRRWYGTGTDIHDARMAEIAGDEVRRRLESTVDGAALGTWEWNIDDGTLVINERWAEILGFTRDELAPVTIDTWRSLCHPDDLQHAQETLRRHLRQESDRYELDLRMRHREGHDVWVRTCGRVLERGPSGRASRMYGLHEDISRRKRMEQRLQESEQRFRRVFEGAADGMLLLEGDRIVDANEAAATMFGIEIGQLVGSCFGDRSPQRQPGGARSSAALKQGLKDAVVGGCPRFEWEHVHEDGSPFWVETILTSLPGAGEPLVHAVLRDIGDRKRLERSLNRSIAAAEDASRAKSEFLANMSHEIRTPMTAILGFVELIERDLRTGDRTVLLPEALATIRRNARSLLGIINDILDLSRIEAGRMELERVASDPAELMQEVADLMRVRAEQKGLTLSLDIDEQVPSRVLTDPGRLRQVLVNLVGNAIKFTNDGEVRMHAGFRDEGDGDRPPSVVIQIIDTGIGMSPEQCRRIFDAFIQGDASTTREYGGTGLGLRISASLVEMLGGSIDVRSEPGVGSTFTIELPLPTAGKETGAASEEEGASGDAGGGAGSAEPAATAEIRALTDVRVLLAEDVADVRRLLTLLLEDEGATVKPVDDGWAAVLEVQMAAKRQQPYDVVLMDMQMPGLDGYGATEQLRADGHELPVIAITAHAMSGDRERCLSVGCDDHLAKPCGQLELSAAIQRQVGRFGGGRSAD